MAPDLQRCRSGAVVAPVRSIRLTRNSRETRFCARTGHPLSGCVVIDRCHATSGSGRLALRPQAQSDSPVATASAEVCAGTRSRTEPLCATSAARDGVSAVMTGDDVPASGPPYDLAGVLVIAESSGSRVLLPMTPKTPPARAERIETNLQGEPMTRPPLSPKSIVLDDNGRFMYFDTDVSDYPFWWTCRDCELTYQETLAVMNERNDGESACPSCKVLAGLCVASGCRSSPAPYAAASAAHTCTYVPPTGLMPLSKGTADAPFGSSRRPGSDCECPRYLSEAGCGLPTARLGLLQRRGPPASSPRSMSCRNWQTRMRCYHPQAAV